MTVILGEGITLRVFENIFLRTFGCKRDEPTGDWRILRNEELYDLFCPPNIIRVLKSRKMRWAGHVAWGKPETDRLEFLGVNRTIIFKRIFIKWDGKRGLN